MKSCGAVSAVLSALLVLSAVTADSRDGVWEHLGAKQALPQKENKRMDKETLAKRIGAIHPEVVDMVLAEHTTIDPIATPFFSDGSIQRVIYPSPYRPVTFVFGFAGKDFAISLAKNPDGFVELAKHAGLLLDSSQMRVAYAEAFLESTRDFQKRLQILRRFEDIELINQPTVEERENYDALRMKYQKQIKPPEVSGKDASVVKLWVLKQQDLLRARLTIADDGSVKVNEETVEKELPIAVVK